MLSSTAAGQRQERVARAARTERRSRESVAEDTLNSNESVCESSLPQAGLQHRAVDHDNVGKRAGAERTAFRTQYAA